MLLSYIIKNLHKNIRLSVEVSYREDIFCALREEIKDFVAVKELPCGEFLL